MVTIFLLRKTIAIREKNNNALISKFQGSDFNPQNEFILNRPYFGEYLGIDTTNGNILMISKLQNIAKGSNCKNLLGYDCRGKDPTLSSMTFHFLSSKLALVAKKKAWSFVIDSMSFY